MGERIKYVFEFVGNSIVSFACPNWFGSVRSNAVADPGLSYWGAPKLCELIN